MNKAFEKILEKLEEYEYENLVERDSAMANHCKQDCNDVIDCTLCVWDKAIEIVKQEAEKFGTDINVVSNGWIPCSERLPEDDSICIVTVEYPNNETMVDYGWFDRNGVCWFVGMHEFRTSNVLAWQPLPEPYKESD